MKIYISGPITNNPRYKEQFAEAEREITAKGHEAVNPVNLQKVLNPITTSWDDYMALCRPLVRICDAIYMLDGWRDSRGATLELKTAEVCGLQIFGYFEPLERKEPAPTVDTRLKLCYNEAKKEAETET